MVGEPPVLTDPKDHLELGESLGLIDMARGAKVSGSRFYFLTGRGALLQLGLLQLALRVAVENGFIPMIPPVLVRPEIMAGTVLATLPMIIVFFLGQRYFVEGIATQGRKG